MPTSPGAEPDYAKLDEYLAGLSRDEIAYLCDAAEAILDRDEPEQETEPEDDGQPSEMQEQSDFASDDKIEPNYLEE